MPSCDSASCASWRCGSKSGVADRVEHGVVGALLRGHAHAERDAARDLAHHGSTPPRRRDRPRVRSVLHGLVAAADVVADAGGRDVALVGDAAADRLAVARVMVGAEHAERGFAGLHAALELLEAAGVDHRRMSSSCSLALLSIAVVGRRRHRAESNRRSALCRRAPRRSATMSLGQAPERNRTSAPGVETRCSVRLSYEGKDGASASTPPPGRAPVARLVTLLRCSLRVEKPGALKLAVKGARGSGRRARSRLRSAVPPSPPPPRSRRPASAGRYGRRHACLRPAVRA